MTSRFGFTELAPGQTDKTTTINDRDQGLEDLFSKEQAFTVSGSFTVTGAQYRAGIKFQLNGTPGSGFNMRLQNIEKVMFVRNSTDAIATVGVDPAGNGFDGDTVEVAIDETAVLYTDGTDTQKLISSEGGVDLKDFKDSVRVATTGAGTLASDFENGDSVDGVTLATGDRILIKDQSTASENGIYTVNASGAPTRAVDFDVDAEVTAGAIIPVAEGTLNGDKLFILTTNDPITVGSTSLAFSTLSAEAESTAVNTQTGMTYTLALTDTNDIVEMNNASANTLTIPANSSIAFPVGTVISITQLGAGATTVEADTGVTLNGISTGSCTLSAQYSGVSIYKRDTDAWVVQGDHGGVA